MSNVKITIIGCGVMGSAFARHLVRKYQVNLYDHHPEKAEIVAKEIGAIFFSDVGKAIRESEIVILAVKPKDLKTVAQMIGSFFTKGHLLISILAGTSVATLKKYFIEPSILRLMPNLALTCRQGILGCVEHPSLSQEKKNLIDSLLSPMGLVCWIPEEKVEAFTALTASAPAFIFVLIEAMIESGILMGFNAEEAKAYSLKMMEGCIALLRETKKHPAELKWQIASPGGITIVGLKTLEEHQVHFGLMSAYLACYNRGKELLEKQ